jgi:hypothetical protein
VVVMVIVTVVGAGVGVKLGDGLGLGMGLVGIRSAHGESEGVLLALPWTAQESIKMGRRV